MSSKATKTAADANNLILSEAEVHLVYAMLVKTGTATIGWAETGRAINTNNPKKPPTLCKRWGRIKQKFEEKFGAIEFETAASSAAGASDTGEAGSVKGKNKGGRKAAGKKRGKDGGNDTEDLAETPSKKTKVELAVKSEDSE